MVVEDVVHLMVIFDRVGRVPSEAPREEETSRPAGTQLSRT